LIFQEKLSAIAQKFLRVESVNFTRAGRIRVATNAVRIAVTKKDGSELQEVVYHNKCEEEVVKGMTDSLRSLIGQNRRLALAALGELSLEILEDGEQQQETR
jgi:hypothetical protein